MDKFIQEKRTRESSHFPSGTLTCLYGRPGCGKTSFLQSEFGHYISIEPDILKTKQGTLDFFERLTHTKSPIVFDNWESLEDLIGIREITGPISPFSPSIIVSHTPVKHTKNIRLLQCPTHEHDFRRSSLDTQGNSRPDTFETARDYVHRLMRGNWNNVRIGDLIHEPGHVWSIIQENYPDRVKSLDVLCTISELMSDSDLLNSYMYRENDWYVSSRVLTVTSCIYPCRLMIPSKVSPRPGSFWTKYQNMCMRRKKLDALFQRSNKILTRETLELVIKNQFQKEHYTACQEYSLDPSDIDILGHIIGPFKQKAVTALKKVCEQNKK